MLVLARQINEIIYIGDDIQILVVDITQGHRGLKVRLGITAPEHIPVHREEIYLAEQRKNAPAVANTETPPQAE